MKVRTADRVREITVRAGKAGEAGVRVDGRDVEVRVARLGAGRYLAESAGRHEVFHCVREGSRVFVFWRGAVHVLHEEREGGRAAAPRAEANRLEAPMPGKVAAVKVTAGQAVTKGQELLIVEAMKMENALRAPRDGRVKAVRAGVGDMVSPGLVLVELE